MCRRGCVPYLLLLLVFSVLVYLDSELTWGLDSALYHSRQSGDNHAVFNTRSTSPRRYRGEVLDITNITVLTATHQHISSDSDDLVIAENVRMCFKSSKLAVNKTVVTAGQRNALWLYREYRTIIPRQSLTSYLSHCWHADYQISVGGGANQVYGHIDKLSFSDQLPSEWYTQTTLNNLKKRSFSTSTVCVPNVYILGVPKCGTTFLWCFINKIIQFQLQISTNESYEKEPHFWTPYQYIHSPPNATHIASQYLSNFVRYRPLSEKQLTGDVLIDGSPNMVLEWPQFSEAEPEITNYCILPSTMTELMPKSKYIIILRNPIEALYSAFWWSLNFIPRSEFSTIFKRRYQAPTVFHKRILDKINKFNLCMTNPRHPNVCVLSNKEGNSSYFDCVREREHLVSECVSVITVPREPYQTVLHKTIYYPHVAKWLSVLPSNRLLVITMEILLNHPLKTANEIMKFLELSNYTSPTLDQRLVEKMTKSCSSNPQLTIDYKSDQKLKMREDTKKLLEEFFSPYNVMLSELLGDHQFVWF